MKENKRQHTRKNKTGTNLDGSNTDEGWDGLIKGALIPIHDEIVQVDVVSAEDFCGSQDGFSEDRKLHKLSAHAMPLRAHSSKNKPHRTTVWTAFLNKSILYRQINTAKSKNELSFSLNKTIFHNFSSEDVRFKSGVPILHPTTFLRRQSLQRASSLSGNPSILG